MKEHSSTTVSRTRDLNRELDEDLDGSFNAEVCSLDPEKLTEDFGGFNDAEDAIMIRPEIDEERTEVYFIMSRLGKGRGGTDVYYIF